MQTTTIQVVLGPELLRAADRTARRIKVNRSALIRDALRDHLKRLGNKEREKRDRDGYRRHPDDPAEARAWAAVASWPEE
jgi:metal-responsive CopG/Arc/MetJ family transcriptional regulator